jgi:hypothetical protein
MTLDCKCASLYLELQKDGSEMHGTMVATYNTLTSTKLSQGKTTIYWNDSKIITTVDSATAVEFKMCLKKKLQWIIEIHQNLK